MMRSLIGLILGGSLGAAAGNYALVEVFDVSLQEIWERLDERGPIFAAALALPILFWLVRGWLGWLVSTLLLSIGASFALKLWLEDGAPWEQVVTLTTIYALVAVMVYRMLISRVLG